MRVAFCCPMLCGYGLTEACAFDLCTPPDRPVRSSWLCVLCTAEPPCMQTRPGLHAA